MTCVTMKRNKLLEFGDHLTNTLVHVAIAIKQSPFPLVLNAVATQTQNQLDSLDDAFQLNNKVISFTQDVVSTAVLTTGLIASAAIKAGVAYQSTPAMNQELYTDGQIYWVKLSSFPGAYPLPDSRDIATQTIYFDKDDSIQSKVLNFIKRQASTDSITLQKPSPSPTSTPCICTQTIPIQELSTCYISCTLINLNIGGKYFSTTYETLTRQPSSKLAKLFIGLIPCSEIHDIGTKFGRLEYTGQSKNTALQCIDGRFFIDRNGDLFIYILDYLRGSCCLDGLSLKDLNLLLIEARYYTLNEFILDIQHEIVKHKISKSVYYWVDGFVYVSSVLAIWIIELKKGIASRWVECLFWVLFIVFLVRVLFY